MTGFAEAVTHSSVGLTRVAVAFAITGTVSVVSVVVVAVAGISRSGVYCRKRGNMFREKTDHLGL